MHTPSNAVRHRVTAWTALAAVVSALGLGAGHAALGAVCGDTSVASEQDAAIGVLLAAPR
jgi:hypothetical protein